MPDTKLLAASLVNEAAEGDLLRREQLLQATAFGITSATGEAFFRLLARHLAQLLRADCAVVSVLLGSSFNRCRTIAYYADQQWLPNTEYDLAGTPCEQVTRGALCIFPSGVQQLFPTDAWLRERQIESYAGTPLYDSRGQVLGLINVAWRTAMNDEEASRFALQIFAARAAAELERQQMLESLRASQAALAESEERFRQMAETIRDLFWLYDVRHERMLYLSPAFESIWGRPAEWVYQDPRRWLEAVHEDDRRAVGTFDVAGGMPRPAAPGKVFDAEYRIYWPDGTLRWLHDRRYAVFGDDGQLARIVGVIEDISERHEAAEKLDQQVTQLAHMARLSTVGELVASISHEVNQPLYAISNFSAAVASVLQQPEKLAVDQVRHWNDEIGKASRRASEIIRRVRSYVLRGPFVRQPIDLRAVVEDSAALLATEARRHRVTIYVALEPGVPPVLGDAIAIQQVLVNLLRNALEATDETAAQRAVWVRTRRNGDYIEILVEDCGTGLTDGDVANLFSAFYTTKPQGMGLGLAISKTIVESHGGRIWATKNAAAGSTFHFTLPLANQPIASPASPEPAGGETGPHCSR